MIALRKTASGRVRRDNPALSTDAQRRFKRLRENNDKASWRATEGNCALDTEQRDIFDQPAQSAPPPATFSWHRTWSYTPKGEARDRRTRYYKGRMYALNNSIDLEDVYEGEEEETVRGGIKFSDLIFIVSALLGYSGLFVCVLYWWQHH